ncbi:hypothetical protein SAMN05421858_3692 [Haladaptatus litoreus]|uniref:DUF7344 domain-containing protein n=1 Tax=Haladaptatus litoreus TaxID=553468 RepID=A0A1N7DKE4_9EURY|nr:hypothetical protein [Haladaptatus litoreus]SIR76251.1 hypothetical protein SAMN05421858_3692 [Haladaptatus litoreus]
MTQPTQDGTRPYLGKEHLTESEYHGVLAAERRRITLRILAELTETVELNDLATIVSKREDKGVDPEHIALTLHHTHLPKMSDIGVINYDPDTTRVELHP